MADIAAAPPVPNTETSGEKGIPVGSELTQADAVENDRVGAGADPDVVASADLGDDAEVKALEDAAEKPADETGAEDGYGCDKYSGKHPTNAMNGSREGVGCDSGGVRQSESDGKDEQKVGIKDHDKTIGIVVGEGRRGSMLGGMEMHGDGSKSDASSEDPFDGLEEVASMDIYDLANYTFGKKDVESKSKVMLLLSRTDMEAALKKSYADRGIRRSVGAILLVYLHGVAHVLLFQRADGRGEYALPGGRLRPGESDEEGLKRKLISKLMPDEGDGESVQELDVGERICNWHCPDFRRRYYPYVPAHISKPKEELHVYFVSLPEKFMFAVPKNLQLLAVPLFELYNNAATYGDVISALPALLSRWHINYC